MILFLTVISTINLFLIILLYIKEFKTIKATKKLIEKNFDFKEFDLDFWSDLK